MKSSKKYIPGFLGTFAPTMAPPISYVSGGFNGQISPVLAHQKARTQVNQMTALLITKIKEIL